MEASAIPATVGLARTRIAIGAPLLRIRSDEQLVSLFRLGSDDAFRAIHDRYRQRLFAYTRQMLAGSAADAEDMVQEIFVRAYAGLRASNRELALRAWLYRIAHNRCIDELRRPQAMPTEEIGAWVSGLGHDPVVRLEQRDALRRLIDDVRRLPAQQRSALLMRELGGMTYADVSGALGISIPAVKSLLVRARVGLARASEARDTECAQIREDLIVAHDRGVRTSGLARRHMRDCESCRQFRTEVRGVSRQLAAFSPALGPLGLLAKLLGVGSAGGGGAWAVAGGGAAAGTGAAASAGAVAGAGHVATLLAAAVVTAGGAIELQHIAPVVGHHPPAHHRIAAARPSTPALYPHTAAPVPAPVTPSAPTASAGDTRSAGTGAGADPAALPAAADPQLAASPPALTLSGAPSHQVPLTQIVDPDTLTYPVMLPPGVPTLNTPPSGTDATTSTGAPAANSTAAAGTPSSASPAASGSASTAPPATTGSGAAADTAAGSSSTAGGATTTAGGTSTPAQAAPAQASGTATSGTGAQSNSTAAPAKSTTSSVRTRASTPRRSSTAGTSTRASRHRSRVLGAAFTMTGS